MRLLVEFIQEVLRETGDKPMPKLQRRFELRMAARETVDRFLEWLIREISQNDLSVIELEVDGEDSVLVVDSAQINFPLDLSSDFFDAVPDVEIEIQVERESGDSWSDAAYLYDPETSDAGSLVLKIGLSTDSDQAVNYLRSNRRFLVAEMVHEMQHAIQRLVYGRSLDGTTDMDIRSHMDDPDEIEARIEETLAILEDDIPEDDLESFLEELTRYVDRYLHRNLPKGRDDVLYDELTERMIDSHLRAYRQMMGAGEGER